MKATMLVAVKFYRSWISPALPGSCRFAPTCSTYALQALEDHGAWKGALLTARRLLKCHPFNPGGYDPVPEPKENITLQISNCIETGSYPVSEMRNLEFNSEEQL